MGKAGGEGASPTERVGSGGGAPPIWSSTDLAAGREGKRAGSGDGTGCRRLASKAKASAVPVVLRCFSASVSALGGSALVDLSNAPASMKGMRAMSRHSRPLVSGSIVYRCGKNLRSGWVVSGALAEMRISAYGLGSSVADAGGSTDRSCSNGRRGREAGQGADAVAGASWRSAATSVSSGAWWYGKYQCHEGGPSR